MTPGTKVEATAKSLHHGQTGTVVVDYEGMLMVEAEDQKYYHAHNNSTHDKKCFQLDSRWAKEIHAKDK